MLLPLSRLATPKRSVVVAAFTANTVGRILRFVDRASLYNLINKNQLDAQFTLSTLYMTRQSSTLNNKFQLSHKYSCFSWWWAHSRPKHVEIDKYTKNKLCTKLVLFKRFGVAVFVNKIVHRGHVTG